ncbi:hypothetical protein [Frankia gtarii]|uniref:hypothetical protein n=1 Tax=Frankia gtarii TaxID=2950102 RepID=UPI0021C16349|nr:hypothetical protein [Frankia gtarii]
MTESEEVLVDAGAPRVRAGGQSWPFTVDLRTGRVTIRIEDVTHTLVPLTWREKLTLARYATRAPELVDAALVTHTLGADPAATISPAAAPALRVLARWINGVDAAAGLDGSALARIALAACQRTGLTLADLDDRDAGEVELLARPAPTDGAEPGGTGARERAEASGGAAPAPGRPAPPHAGAMPEPEVDDGVTRILIVPDPVRPAGPTTPGQSGVAGPADGREPFTAADPPAGTDPAGTDPAGTAGSGRRGRVRPTPHAATTPTPTVPGPGPGPGPGAGPGPAAAPGGPRLPAGHEPPAGHDSVFGPRASAGAGPASRPDPPVAPSADPVADRPPRARAARHTDVGRPLALVRLHVDGERGDDLPFLGGPPSTSAPRRPVPASPAPPHPAARGLAARDLAARDLAARDLGTPDMGFRDMATREVGAEPLPAAPDIEMVIEALAWRLEQAVADLGLDPEE